MIEGQLAAQLHQWVVSWHEGSFTTDSSLGVATSLAFLVLEAVVQPAVWWTAESLHQVAGILALEARFQFLSQFPPQSHDHTALRAISSEAGGTTVRGTG